MNFKRFLIAAFALLLVTMPLPAFAQEEMQTVIDGIMEHSRGDLSIQDWVDGPVSEAAGSTMDNYILTLNRLGAAVDCSSYIRNAAQIIENGKIANPVSRQRCALALISCGAMQHVPQSLVDETTGKLGVMSYVYGLYLVKNGASSALWTCEGIADEIINLQKQDGGWAVMGSFGDVDVTAMCLQALSCCDKNDRVNESIERALEFLSSVQLENGGFFGMGKENAESISQVVAALASLGVDPATDARFCKNSSAQEAFLAYRLSNGAFAHFPGETVENDTATVQALQAASALYLFDQPYFDFSLASPQKKDIPVSAMGWKLWAYIAITVLGLAGCIFALTRRRGRMKQLAFVILLAGAAALIVNTINIESTASYYGKTDSVSEKNGSVWLSIRCDTVAGLADDGSTPESGIILERTEFDIAQGDSVFDVLTDAARRFEIHMEHEGGNETMAYINGINYLYEYVYGDLSGWMYLVNGVDPSIGCGSYILSDGDEIIWQYTRNLGEDLK